MWIDATMLRTVNSKGEATTTRRKAAAAAAPCGACKFLRRKCENGCVFSQHFSSEQGTAKFAAVHKVFGASNVSKLLKVVPPPRRPDAVLTVCYEAQARLSDPVLGCVATILALHHQVMQLQAELSIIKSQLKSSRLPQLNSAMQQQVMASQQPAYSNSPASSHSFNLSNFPSSHIFYGAPTLEISHRSRFPQLNSSSQQQVIASQQPTYSNSSISCHSFDFSNFPSSHIFYGAPTLEFSHMPYSNH